MVSVLRRRVTYSSVSYRLSKRVTQVWFQNSRARQKKHQQQTQRKLNSANGGGSGSRQTGHNSPEKISSASCRIQNDDDQCGGVDRDDESSTAAAFTHHHHHQSFDHPTHTHTQHHLHHSSLSPASSEDDNLDSSSQFSSSFLWTTSTLPGVMILIRFYVEIAMHNFLISCWTNTSQKRVWEKYSGIFVFCLTPSSAGMNRWRWGLFLIIDPNLYWMKFLYALLIQFCLIHWKNE